MQRKTQKLNSYTYVARTNVVPSSAKVVCSSVCKIPGSIRYAPACGIADFPPKNWIPVKYSTEYYSESKTEQGAETDSTQSEVCWTILL